MIIYLVSLVGLGGGALALLAAGELGKVTVVITLPVMCALASMILDGNSRSKANIHLVVEDLGLSGLGLGNEGLVKDVEDILADLLELELDLLAVLADDGDVLLRALLLLLLLDRGNDAPGCTAGTDDVLVGD